MAGVHSLSQGGAPAAVTRVHSLERAWPGETSPMGDHPRLLPCSLEARKSLHSTGMFSLPQVEEIKREITPSNEVGLCQKHHRISIHKTLIY